MSSKVVKLPQGQGRVDRPLSDQLHEVLREDILSGRIAPGSKMKIEALQQRFETSNTPLREALNRLAAEGLAVSDERRGFRAPEATLAQFEDLNAFRLVVEEGALASAIEHGGDDWTEGVLAAFEALELVDQRSGRPSASEEWRRRHKVFHMALFAGGVSERLKEACDHAFDQGERFRRLAAIRRAEPRHQDGEHAAIVRAVLDRDTRLATALLRAHLLKTAAHVRRFLIDRFEPSNVQRDAAS